MAAYNAAETIGDAIRSALGQTDRDFELLVVDDGSTDDTSEQVSRFDADRRVRLLSQPNAGLAGARNRALEEARGRYASFLDADDLLLPTYLEKLRATLHAAPDAGFADCDHWVLDDATGRISPWDRGNRDLPQEPYELMRIVLQGNVIHYGATVRMAVLEQVGFFNPALRACEDIELWLRILAHGYRLVRARRKLAVYRTRSGSLSRNTLLMRRSLAEVYRLVAEEYEVPDDIRALARVRRSAVERSIAALTGERRLAAAGLRVRGQLGKARRGLRRARGPGRIPPDVAAAFPGLGRPERAPGPRA